MADQTLAQNGALKETAKEVHNPTPTGQLFIRFKRACNLVRCSLRYALWGTPRGVPELVKFVIGDHFFPAFQVGSELVALGEILAREQPEVALEIGTARGGTLFFLTRLANPSATIVSVDLPAGEFGGGYGPGRQWFYQRFAKRDQNLHLLQGNSHNSEMLARVRTAIGDRPLDYLFIDGDHRYEGVRSDFEMYGPLVRKGGLIAFHDIVNGPTENVGGVPRFWRDIKAHYRYSELVEDPGQVGWGIGVLYVD